MDNLTPCQVLVVDLCPFPYPLRRGGEGSLPCFVLNSVIFGACSSWVTILGKPEMSSFAVVGGTIAFYSEPYVIAGVGACSTSCYILMFTCFYQYIRLRIEIHHCGLNDHNTTLFLLILMIYSTYVQLPDKIVVMNTEIELHAN